MKCEICHKNPATIKYSDEPYFAMSHGFGIQHICKPCMIKKVKKHIIDCQEQLKELEGK